MSNQEYKTAKSLILPQKIGKKGVRTRMKRLLLISILLTTIIALATTLAAQNSGSSPSTNSGSPSTGSHNSTSTDHHDYSNGLRVRVSDRQDPPTPHYTPPPAPPAPPPSAAQRILAITRPAQHARNKVMSAFLLKPLTIGPIQKAVNLIPH